MGCGKPINKITYENKIPGLGSLRSSAKKAMWVK